MLKFNEVEEEGAHQELIDKDGMYALLVRELHVTGTDIIADEDDQPMDEDYKAPEEPAPDEATIGGSEEQMRCFCGEGEGEARIVCSCV